MGWKSALLLWSSPSPLGQRGWEDAFCEWWLHQSGDKQKNVHVEEGGETNCSSILVVQCCCALWEQNFASAIGRGPSPGSSCRSPSLCRSEDTSPGELPCHAIKTGGLSSVFRWFWVNPYISVGNFDTNTEKQHKPRQTWALIAEFSFTGLFVNFIV